MSDTYGNQAGQRLDLPDPTVTARGRGTTGMEYQIIGTTLQAVIIELDPGETVYSESGGMAWMSGNIATGRRPRRYVQARDHWRKPVPQRVHLAGR
jgi:hypothetical protein